MNRDRMAEGRFELPYDTDGVVVKVRDAQVAVKIDQPGTFGETLGGTELKKGEIIWDEPYGWTPCY